MAALREREKGRGGKGRGWKEKEKGEKGREGGKAKETKGKGCNGRAVEGRKGFILWGEKQPKNCNFDEI